MLEEMRVGIEDSVEAWARVIMASTEGHKGLTGAILAKVSLPLCLYNRCMYAFARTVDFKISSCQSLHYLAIAAGLKGLTSAILS